ncbi:MAG: ASKHA domain-containing protein [Dissulfurispiraceae bacterium]
MPILTVKQAGKDRHIIFISGRSVRDILDETDLRVRSGCDGAGACGMCRIRVVGGHAGEPSVNELANLGAGLLSQSVRLACQVKAERDLQIEILSRAPRSVWRSLDQGGAKTCIPATAAAPHPETEHPLGVSVDIGTTHISISLLDIHACCRLAGRLGLNPQSDSGADVLTRLISAQTYEQGEKLSQQVIQSIGEGLHDIGSREGIDLRRVERVVLVGNTAMLSLLSGQNRHLLLQPRYWSESIECLPLETASWGASWGISPGAAIDVIPPLAGFVGSDLLSGVLATGLMEHGGGALLIDFGTNSEVALWDGNKIWVTSAAGGPAFEGCGISCGMPAEPGAIYRVYASDETGELAFEIVADAEPRGLCGSGMVDLLACLVRNRTLNKKGQFASSVQQYGFPLRRGDLDIVLTKRDIDIFQRAKAAIGVAVNVLLTKAGIGYRELRRICIGGVFGQYLNIVNAQEIGLLPAIPGLLIETSGNTALSGCETLLLSPEADKRLQEVRSRAVLVNLANVAEFESLFLENLYLKPANENMGHD